MDVYKGTGAFSGIAIGKILYYHKSEYQMRQYEITDVENRAEYFPAGAHQSHGTAGGFYMKKNCIIQGTQAEIFLQTEESAGGKKTFNVPLRVSYRVKK